MAIQRMDYNYNFEIFFYISLQLICFSKIVTQLCHSAQLNVPHAQLSDTKLERLPEAYLEASFNWSISIRHSF